jgi:hypothetical protein
MQNFVWALNTLDRRQVDMCWGSRVKGGSTWELDSVLSSMYLPTYICCLSLVRQCWEIATQSVPTHCKPFCQNWPVGTKIGNISPCRRHVADMSSTCCQHLQPSRQDATHNTNTQQTPPPWWWSRQPLWWHGFDESMLPKGRAALRISLPRPPSNSFDRFFKLM